MNDVRITQSIKEITEKQVCMGALAPPMHTQFPGFSRFNGVLPV
jgi:hypothetical protein